MDSWDIINKLNKEYDELYNEAESFKKELKKSKYVNCLHDIELHYRDFLMMETEMMEESCIDIDEDPLTDRKSIQSQFLDNVKSNNDCSEHICFMRERMDTKESINELESDYEKKLIDVSKKMKYMKCIQDIQMYYNYYLMKIARKENKGYRGFLKSIKENTLMINEPDGTNLGDFIEQNTNRLEERLN